jgi:hypothetical protein
MGCGSIALTDCDSGILDFDLDRVGHKRALLSWWRVAKWSQIPVPQPVEQILMLHEGVSDRW